MIIHYVSESCKNTEVPWSKMLWLCITHPSKRGGHSTQWPYSITYIALLTFNSSCKASNYYFINEQITVRGKMHISSAQIFKSSTNTPQGHFTHCGLSCSIAAFRGTTYPTNIPGWTTVHISALFTVECSLYFLIVWYKDIAHFNYFNNSFTISQTYPTLHWSFVHDFFHYIGFLRGGQSSSRESKEDNTFY